MTETIPLPPTPVLETESVSRTVFGGSFRSQKERKSTAWPFTSMPM